MNAIKQFIAKWLAKLAPQQEQTPTYTRKQYILKYGPGKTRARTYIAIGFAVLALLLLAFIAVQAFLAPFYELPTLVILHQEIAVKDNSLIDDMINSDDPHATYRAAQENFQTFAEAEIFHDLNRQREGAAEMVNLLETAEETLATYTPEEQEMMLEMLREQIGMSLEEAQAYYAEVQEYLATPSFYNLYRWLELGEDPFRVLEMPIEEEDRETAMLVFKAIGLAVLGILALLALMWLVAVLTLTRWPVNLTALLGFVICFLLGGPFAALAFWLVAAIYCVNIRRTKKHYKKYLKERKAAAPAEQ